jgi:hypothetical protein
MQACEPVKDDGEEGRRSGDHEWNLRDRVATKRVDVQQGAGDAGGTH